MTAGMPVLVSSLGELQPPARAIGIIRDEHRSLAAVLHAWMHALATACAQGAGADPVLMRAMVSYIQKFPLALHHPKEEDHLFKRLRERTDLVDGELDELGRQHERDRVLVDELAQQVQRLEQAGTAAAATITSTLEQSVRAYAATLWDHMGREEGVILPAAQRHLNDDDWRDIDAAFAANRDPGFGGETEREFHHLFSRIVNAVKN
jgi:hemerythrin-like domain-containing protein